MRELILLPILLLLGLAACTVVQPTPQPTATVVTPVPQTTYVAPVPYTTVVPTY
jgi:hypothetical protein